MIVRKRQRRVSDVDEIVLSLYAKGLTTGEISAHFEQIYGARVSRDTVSRITDRVIEEMHTWSARPLEAAFAAVFIDAIMVKIRDGQVGNRPAYAAIGVDLEGHRDILGMWAGNGDGESAKLRMAVLTDLKNRGSRMCLRRVRRPQGTPAYELGFCGYLTVKAKSDIRSVLRKFFPFSDKYVIVSPRLG